MICSVDLELAESVGIVLCEAEGMWKSDRVVASGPAYKLAGGSSL
jgi:hypothetical protein